MYGIKLWNEKPKIKTSAILLIRGIDHDYKHK